MNDELFQRLWRMFREPDCVGAHDHDYHHSDGKVITLTREFRYPVAKPAIERAINSVTALSMYRDHEGVDIDVRCLKRGRGGWVVELSATIRDKGVLTSDQYLVMFPDDLHRCPGCNVLIEWDRDRCPSCVAESGEVMHD